jgi:hypothetical protein
VDLAYLLEIVIRHLFDGRWEGLGPRLETLGQTAPVACWKSERRGEHDTVRARLRPGQHRAGPEDPQGADPWPSPSPRSAADTDAAASAHPRGGGSTAAPPTAPGGPTLSSSELNGRTLASAPSQAFCYPLWRGQFGRDMIAILEEGEKYQW